MGSLMCFACFLFFVLWIFVVVGVFVVVCVCVVVVFVSVCGWVGLFLECSVNVGWLFVWRWTVLFVFATAG